MKSLAQNSLYNILYKCSNLIFPLIISAYASRILMAEGIGKVSSAQNIVTYFTLLAALGLPTYGTKVVAALGETRDSRSKVFSELFCINAVSTVICTIVYYSMIYYIPYFQQRLELFVVCGLAIVFNIINVDWFYQGREEYGYIMLRSFIVKLVSLMAVFIFVKSIDDYIVYAAILTLSKVANNIFNIIHLRKYAYFTLNEINIFQHIKPVLVLLVASIAIEIYTLADTTMLTFIHGETIVGYYATARKGIDVIRTMMVAVCAVFLPRLSYYYKNQQIALFDELVNKGIEILTFMSVPATIGVILTADYFIPLLFGNDFIEAIRTTQILSFSLITVAFSNFFGYQVLVTVGKEKQMMFSTIIGAVVNIVLNFVLIFSLKHNGVAIASAVTELCVALYQIWAVRNIIHFKISRQFFASVCLGTGVMIVVVMLCKRLIHGLLTGLILSIPMGMIVYMWITFISGNKISREIFSKIKSLLFRNVAK